jgi:hypothetical protein
VAPVHDPGNWKTSPRRAPREIFHVIRLPSPAQHHPRTRRACRSGGGMCAEALPDRASAIVGGVIKGGAARLVLRRTCGTFLREGQ